MKLNEEKNYWLAFSAFPGIGPLRFKLLLKYFGSAKKAWQANTTKLIKIGLGKKLTEKFVTFRNEFSLSGFNQLLQKKNIKTLTHLDKNYPPLLKEISASPFVLYVRGEIASEWWSKGETIAVVGTRQPTNYGVQISRKITQGLTACGLTIVSGMAYGVDTIAHEAAIATGGQTIAVLGCGIDIIYPPTNEKLYWKIINGCGAVVSEFPPGHFVLKGLFPSRNRIISGLSRAVLVTEGAADSGALITAAFAAEQGRDVFAVPGPITSPMSAAPTKLLKEGAKMVTEVEDILEELNIKNNPITQLSNNPINQKIKGLTNDERKIVELLLNENLHFDEIVRKSRMNSSKVGSLLTLMEMRKIIKNLGSGVYAISS